MTDFFQSYQFLSIIGLVIDIIGVIFLFFTGLPFKLPDLDSYTEIKVKPDQIIKDRKQKRLAYIAVILLLVGFIIQIISSVVSFCES